MTHKKLHSGVPSYQGPRKVRSPYDLMPAAAAHMTLIHLVGLMRRNGDVYETVDPELAIELRRWVHGGMSYSSIFSGALLADDKDSSTEREICKVLYWVMINSDKYLAEPYEGGNTFGDWYMNRVAPQILKRDEVDQVIAFSQDTELVNARFRLYCLIRNGIIAPSHSV